MSNRWPAIIALLFFSTPALSEQSTVVIPDKAGDFKNGVYHTGFLVGDLDGMAAFLEEYSSLAVISRVRLPDGGERLFMEDANGGRIELLTDPSRPIIDGEGAARVHLAIEADDVAVLKAELLKKGYEIVFQAATNFDDGYVVSEVDAHRVLYIKGPEGFFFEFFEIRK